jgi:hypothetical protein
MSGFIHIRRQCRLCGSAGIVKSIPLAQVPVVSPNVGTEQDDGGERLTLVVAPLDNYLCEDCGLIRASWLILPSLWMPPCQGSASAALRTAGKINESLS